MMRRAFRNSIGAGIIMLVAGASATLVTNALAARAERSAEDIYLDKCAVCHGKDGAGRTAKGKKAKVKDVRQTVSKISEEEMIKIVQKGKDPNMDAYAKEFSKDQLKALVKYYRSLATQ